VYADRSSCTLTTALKAEGGSCFLLGSFACFPFLPLSKENGEPFLEAACLLVPGLLSYSEDTCVPIHSRTPCH
jgi:hypothetical protein